jgi:5-methylcytosine-specific restriction protein A
MRAHDFTRQQRAEIAKRAGFHCQMCGLNALPGEADHILPVELGGESEVENGRWLCAPCHRSKTKADIQGIRKADRVRDRNNGVMPKSRRGFRGWRLFNGTIVRRDGP